MTSTNIRGLINFIGDIRNCKTEDEERNRVDQELAKIRSTFAKPGVGSYAKKKYMWKIMYMFILGYQVDFGHMQCVDLIRSQKYAEKQVGYVGVSLLLIEYTEMLRLCIQTIKNDLNSRNEIFQCLALTCIANVGGVEFAESLMTDVQQLLISGTSRNFVRKKAALCLLRLLRQYPDNLPSPEFAPEVIKLAEHRNVGVVTSVMSLLTGLATYDPQNYSDVIPAAVRLLHQFVIQRECSKEYIYYRTPCPWLQVKLLRILQYYPPPSEKADVNKLHDILDRIVTKTEVTQSVNKNHADHAILFEAMNVIIHLNLHGEDMLHDRAIHKLLHFINVKEGNIRYLGLDAMARLAKISGTHKLIKRHLRTIQYSLDDSDISIRKRALDLLYSICDEDNVVEIIEHLLRYLSKAEYAIREEMVLKIAILAEKFATEMQWYINVILQLLTIAGDFVSEDVCHRVVQIVTNNEELQRYAAEMVAESLQNPPIHESLVKVAGYILGEFGHLLDSEGKDQFELLHKHFHSATLETKALLLSTYMKFANMYENLSATVIPIFQTHRSAVDPEIQQRAVEYEVMARYDNQELIAQVWEAMPDFPERGVSNLIKIVKQKEGGRFEKDPFSDNDEEKGDGDDDEYESDEESESEEMATDEASAPVTAAVAPVSAAVAEPVEDLLSGLFDDGPMDGLASTSTATGGAVQQTTLAFSDTLFSKLLTTSHGVLYEDKNVQIGARMQSESGVMDLILYFGNKCNDALVNVSTTRTDENNAIQLYLDPSTPLTVPGNQQLQQKCRILYMQPSNAIPTVGISFQCGDGQYTLNAKLPVLACKFFAAHTFEASQFKQRWQQVAKEEKQVLQINTNQQMDVGKLRKMLTEGMGLGLIEAVDNNPNNSVGCASFHFATKKQGKNITMPVLARVEFNEPKQALRVTVRTPHASASAAVMLAFQQVFCN